jgi:hypothetical protein
LIDRASNCPVAKRRTLAVNSFLNLLLLAGNRLGFALAGPGVGVGPLATHRQLTPVAKPAIAAKVHQTLDVDRNLAAKIAFDHKIAVDRLSNLQHLRVRQFGDAALDWNIDFFAKQLGFTRANAMNVLKRDNDTLIGWNINASDTCQDLFSIWGRCA